MTTLYKFSKVKDIHFKDFKLDPKLCLNTNILNNNSSILVFYSPNCIHCRKSVALWSELANNFSHKFNILAYNINLPKNRIVREYISIPHLPFIRYITKTGKMNKLKEDTDYNSLFYFICKNSNC